MGARDEHLERPVAIKQLHTVAGMPEDEAELAKRRAMREARITARLHHPHAVPVFDAVEHEGKPCLVMPLLPSTPLSAVLHQRETLPLAEAARIGAEVASALAAAHRLGIVHRDVKPGNILITPDGAAHISDFGISHAMGDPTLTGSGMVHGTPAYLAPEVARGQAGTFASDVFSLGSTLYAALEGNPPFGSEPNSLALLHRVAAAQVRPPRHAGSLAPYLLRMLAREPDARPTMPDVAASLAGLETEAPSVEPTPPPPVVATNELVPGPGDGQEKSRPTLAGAIPTGPSMQAAPTAPAAGLMTELMAAGAAPTARAEPGRPPTRNRPLVPVLVGMVIVAALLVVAVLTGWFDQDPRAADELGAAPPTSATEASPRVTSPASSPEAVVPPPTPTPQPSGTQEPAPGTEAAQPTPKQESPPDDSSSDAEPDVGEADVGEPDRADRLASAITSYYALMPEDTDAGWPRMTGDYRQNHAGGRAAYEEFWDDIAEVTVSDVQPVPPDRAEATLRYVFNDGRVVIERTAYRFAEEGGTLRIAATDVLSSTQA